MERSDGKGVGEFSGSFSSDAALFDASQYAFFGRDAVEDVELGGLEDEVKDVPVLGFGNDEYHLFDKDQVNRMSNTLYF